MPKLLPSDNEPSTPVVFLSVALDWELLNSEKRVYLFHCRIMEAMLF